MNLVIPFWNCWTVRNFHCFEFGSIFEVCLIGIKSISNEMKARKIGEKDAKKKELFTLYTSSFFKGHFLVTQRVSEGQTIKVQQLSVLMWLPWHTKISATKKRLKTKKGKKSLYNTSKELCWGSKHSRKKKKEGVALLDGR